MCLYKHRERSVSGYGRRRWRTSGGDVWGPVKGPRKVRFGKRGVGGVRVIGIYGNPVRGPRKVRFGKRGVDGALDVEIGDMRRL